jgi:hypothetical protein
MLLRHMKAKTSAHPCCSTKTQGIGRTQRPAPHWRRGGEFAAWIFPSAVLVLLPKCPMCIAAYVALFSGVGISVATAANVRISVLILCMAALVGLALKRVCRVTSRRPKHPQLRPPANSGPMTRQPSVAPAGRDDE